MLGLYLDILIIGHKCCSMFSLLNEITLKMNCKISGQIMCFEYNSKNTTTTTTTTEQKQQT